MQGSKRRMPHIFQVRINLKPNPGNRCPTGHSTEFCRGWDDASRANNKTATSISSSNSGCVQLGGDIRNALDQQHFCIGENDGKTKLTLILRIIPN